MSVEVHNTQMYHLERAVYLPERLDMPKTMYELQPTYDLPSNVGDTYYISPGNQPSFKPNICCNGIVDCCTDEFSDCIHNLETKQKVVLEKLQLFKGRLESLLGNNARNFESNVTSNDKESADVANRKKIVNVIDSLKERLINKHVENQNEASFCDFDLSEKWHGNLLKQLRIFQEETESIAYNAENFKFLSHEDDLRQRQEAILMIIDALEQLMKTQIPSQSSCLEDPTKLGIESYHCHVLKLVEVLQNDLCKISKKFIYEPIEHTAICSCNLPESDIVLTTKETSPVNQLKRGTLSLESNMFCRNEFILKKSGYIDDIVVSANPLKPPYSIIIVKNILESTGTPVLLSSKIHSSLDQLLIDPKVSRLFQEENTKERGTYDLVFTVLWKKQEMSSFMVSPLSHSEIYGEANILRYISRILPPSSPLKYEMRENLAEVSQTDYWLDAIQSKFLQGSNKERLSFVKQLNARLGSSQWIVGNSFGLADIFACSVILQLNMKENLPNNATKWINATTKLCGGIFSG